MITPVRSFFPIKSGLCCLLFFVSMLGTVSTWGQTNPTAQSLPYTQDFSGLTHAGTAYPAGWQGWQLSTGGPAAAFRVTAPTANLGLTASSTAATNSGGMHNYNGKIGLLQSGSNDPAIALAINTTGLSSVKVSYDIMTIRNPYDGNTNTRINEATLQYRVGTSGNFTTLTGIEYQNNTTAQTTAVTTPQNLQSKTITLPAACNNNAVVQLRWVARDVSGVGARASFAVDNITICTPPPCNVTGADFICNNSTGNVYTAPPGMSAYSWGISGAGSIPGSTTGQSVSVTAGNLGGDYTVSVTITDANGCTSSCSKQSYVVFSKPPADITINPNPACFGATLDLSISAASSSTVSWTGEGIVNPSGNPSTTAIPTTTGPHIYSVTVTSSFYFGGCSNTGTATVTVYPAPPTCSITGPTSACANSTGNVYSAPGGLSAYSWGVSGGTIVGSTTGSYVSVTAGASGTYTVSVTLTDANGCTSTCSQPVTINPLPVCSIIGPPGSPGPSNDTLCIGQQYVFTGPPGMSAYQWGVSANGTINGSNTGSSVTVTVNSGSSLTVFVTITDANGCMSNCSLNRNVQQSPTCSVSGPLTVCSGSAGNVYSVTSNAGAFGYYVWSISGDGVITSSPTSGFNLTSVTVTAGASGAYTVTVETKFSFNTCFRSCSETVTINNASTPTITGPASVCLGGSALLDAGAGYSSYAWSNGGGSGQTATFNNIISPTTYTVTVTDGNGCTGTDTQTVSVNAAPTPTITGPTTVCASGSALLDAGAGYASYAWSNSGGSGQTATFSNINATTTYTVTVTDANGCAGSDTHTVAIQSCNNDFSGKIIFSNNNALGVKSATVKLTGSATGTDLSDVNGDFEITTALTNGSYTLKPTKNINKFNGVNAGDVTAIQQHVTFAVPITDPYKLVCADVNKSNSITTSDASLITQAMLGNPQANAIFNTSWRFVPTSHTMSMPPWGFPEQRTYTNIFGPQFNQDFYGMKIGDVVTAFANPANFGAGEPLVLRAKDQLLQSGKTVAIDFSADQLDDLAAFQFGLTFDPAQLQFEAVESTGGLPVSADHFGTYDVADGEIRAVWAQATGIRVEEATPAFRLRFTALQSGAKLSDVLQLNDAVLPALSFTSKLAESKVELTFSEATGTTDPASVAALQMQVRPNPFREETTVTFTLPAAGEAQLRVLDVSGRELMRISNTYPAGHHSETLRLDGVTAPGVLTCELITPFGVATRKLVVVN